jgi:Ca-activated chloride channel homolog
VVIALDYSKSMYARDISPSRTLRAKSEVSRLVSQLRGARFGAVAFAGEPMTFPLTSDGAAIAQFFRQLTPNDMPVGGTSLARAIAAGRDLFMRDPSTQKHAKVLVLVTDGEDLEGDPATVAKEAHQDGISVDVVQIGGRTPEPIPEIDDSGKVRGWRKDSQGSPLTTSLSAQGEAQLAETAKAGGGFVVRSGSGSTGIDKMSQELSRWMSSELSEKVETVYADVYGYPLGLAILLLIVEVFVGQGPKHKTRTRNPDGPAPRRTRAVIPKTAPVAMLIGAAIPFVCVALTSCQNGFKDPFIRHAPDVESAITALDAGNLDAGVDLLERYLSTGKCTGGNIGTPDSILNRNNAAFDLGLALFQVAEKFGGRFGDPSSPINAQQSPALQQQLAQRGEQIDCALRVVMALTDLPTASTEFKARAHYLAGNLYFLREEYKKAVASYDQALRLIPGLEGNRVDAIGRDAAWNRALALERADQKPPPDAGQDGGNQNPGDAGSPQPDAGKNPPQPDAGGQQPPDAGNNGQDKNKDKDKNKNKNQPDAGSPPPPKNADAGAPPPQPKDAPQPSRDGQNQDDRILDALEQTPSLDEHMAKENAHRRRGIVRMEDK